MDEILGMACAGRRLCSGPGSAYEVWNRMKSCGDL
jgi:hypothetical protein